MSTSASNNDRTVTITVRTSRETKEQLEALAENMGRSTNYIADEALSSYISENAWQVEAIRKAVEQADAGGPFVAMEDVKRACGQKPRASYGKWAKPLREGHGKTQRFRHSSVSLWPRSGDAAPACPGFLTKCANMRLSGRD